MTLAAASNDFVFGMNWLSPGLRQKFASGQTDAYRIADAEDIWIERFGDGAIISHATETLPPGVLKDLVGWGQRAGVVLRRIYGRRLVKMPHRTDAPYVIEGASSQHKEIANEEGLS